MSYLSETSARHVTSDLEGELGLRPGVSLVGGTKNSSRIWVPFVSVKTNSHDDTVWVNRVSCDSIDSHEVATRDR